jgi:hypothetical protein
MLAAAPRRAGTRARRASSAARADLGGWILIAVGAALGGGTGAALLRYRQTGAFPGQPAARPDGSPVPVSVRAAVVKCVVGVALLVWGVATVAAY